MDIRYTLGLDLGQVRDYTALSIGEWDRDASPRRVSIRHLHRFELGTPYPNVVDHVEKQLFARGRDAEFVLVSSDCFPAGFERVAMLHEGRGALFVFFSAQYGAQGLSLEKTGGLDSA